jgi:hypothetical protein
MARDYLAHDREAHPDAFGFGRKESVEQPRRDFRIDTAPESGCSLLMRAVEVRLFRTGRLYDRAPMDTRRWEPGSDLPKTAMEISKYIADSGAAEATIVASERSLTARAISSV